MDTGEYRAASVQAERIYIDADNHHERAEAVLARSHALKHLREYEDAIENLRRASMPNVSDELEYLILHERVLLYYLNGDWSDSLTELERLHHFVDNRDWRLQSEYLGILALAEQQRWDEAKNRTEEYFDKLGIEEDLTEVFEADRPDLKNPETAALWSTFLPGTGQMYSGHHLEGIGSAILQLASLGWGVYNVIQGFYATALITGGGLFQAFYFGGIERAESLSEQSNVQNTASYNRHITNWLLDKIEPVLHKKRRTPERSPFENT